MDEGYVYAVSHTALSGRGPGLVRSGSPHSERGYLSFAAFRLWVKNAPKESALIAEMRKGVKLVIKAASLRGHQSVDTYSLGGFAQAMDRLQKECPRK
jgi:hypothetical protein